MLVPLTLRDSLSLNGRHNEHSSALEIKVGPRCDFQASRVEAAQDQKTAGMGDLGVAPRMLIRYQKQVCLPAFDADCVIL